MTLKNIKDRVCNELLKNILHLSKYDFVCVDTLL